MLALFALNAMNDISNGHIDIKRIRANIEHLAAMQTRNTSSSELETAANYIADEYRKIPGIQVEIMRYPIVKGRRVPMDKDVVQVIATLPGFDDRIIMAGGHFDTINLSEDPLTGRAPGANDDASGTCLAIEMARVMALRKWTHTLKFVAFSGEEQGLFGSRALAKRARAEGWKIDALLSNDTVGSSSNKDGQKDANHVRVFSEEWLSSQQTPAHNSRELARFAEWATRGKNGKFGIKLVLRKDRFGRGGDHSPFNDEGFTAVRFVEVFEEYSRQHTVDDLPQFIDWKYLENVARTNLLVLEQLANAGPPPTDVRVKLDQSHDTTLTWNAARSTDYVVYVRDTRSAAWEKSFDAGKSDHFVVQGMNKDDNIFAVGAKGGVPVAAR